GVALAQPGVVATVEELQRLHDELDLTDAAAAELDVGARRPAAPAQRAVDLALHRADRGQDALVHAGPVDDGARPVHEARADARIAGGHPGLEQRLALPQLGALLVIRAEGVERQRHRAHAALRAQAQVHAADV